MLLNSKYNDFVFKFPPMFFPKKFDNKYLPFLNRSKIPFTSITDYINYTIQSVSWPSITTETIEQFYKNGYRVYKGGWDLLTYTSREIVVTFKTVESYINYFIMQDLLEYYWDIYQGKEENMSHLPNLYLMLLDRYGYLIVTFKYTNVVFHSLSELELSYASNVPEFRTFTATFKSSIIQTIREYDKDNKILY